jgi:hypothetical protein
MCREIQNPQIFQPNPESIFRAIIFSIATFALQSNERGGNISYFK